MFKPIDSFKAVILDMDGVLVDTEPIHMQSFRIFMDNLRIDYPENLPAEFIGFSIANNVETINERFLKGRELDIACGVKERDSIYIGLLKKQRVKTMPGITTLIHHCQKQHMPLALATSSSAEQVDIILNNLSEQSANRFDFRSVFRFIVNGDDVTATKPAPDIYQTILDLLRLPAPSCLAIEDSTAGIRSAKTAGIHCYGLKSPFSEAAELTAAGADALLDSINDLL